MEPKRYFPYGNEEIAYLAQKDAKLGWAISRIGLIQRPVEPNLFEAVVSSIAGQQISGKALATIWGRIQKRFVPLTPETLAAAPLEELQQCGMPLRKASCIQGMAQAVLQGELALDSLQVLPDAEVQNQLTRLKGIGPWTAEMLLIFSLERQDVVSFGDLAIQRGMRMLSRHRTITPKLFDKYRRRYSPYGSVASLYLWAIAGGAIPELTDPAWSKTK